MKTLLITAHPSTAGFTHRVAEQYAGTKHTQGSETEIIDLYDEQYQQNFLQFEEKSDMDNPDSVRDIIQEKISEADELVFVFPLWWGDAPAIMKNFIDKNFTSGFAFQFEKGKSMPKKLLTGKTAQIFITCDAPKILYWFKAFPFNAIWKDFILGFCGIEVENITIFDQMMKRNEKQKNKFLEIVTKRALG